MKSILRTAAASLTLAAMAAISSPAFAHQDRAELRFGNGQDQQRAYVQPGVIYEAPAPLYRYQDEDGWRRQQWREQAWRRQQWREHAWRERERERERRERYWQEQHGRDHEQRYYGHDEPAHHGDWR